MLSQGLPHRRSRDRPDEASSCLAQGVGTSNRRSKVAGYRSAGVLHMTRIPELSQPKPRANRRFRPGLVLTIIALGILATGCIQGHDPRNDSSRLESPSHAIDAISSSDLPA